MRGISSRGVGPKGSLPPLVPLFRRECSGSGGRIRLSAVLLPAGILAGNRVTPAPTRTPLLRLIPGVATADPWIITFLLSCLLAFGIPAVVLLSLVKWERSRYQGEVPSSVASRGRAAGLAVAAGIMWLSALLILFAVGARLGKAGLITTAVPLTAPVVYLGLSSLVLARGAARGRRHPLLSSLHVPLCILALAGLAAIYALTPVRREAAVLTLAASLLGSALLAFWHRPAASVPGSAPAGGGATLVTMPGGAGAGRQAPVPPPVPGIRFPPELEGRFTRAEYLGGGGVARIFRARMTPGGKDVVVKIPLRFDEATGRSFLKEIRVWEQLHHPRIVEILEANILPVPYVVMEYYPSSLERLPLPLPFSEAVRIVAGILEGLTYAHVQGIVHRDLKPQNILIGADGWPRIADWGLSSSAGAGGPGTVQGFSLAYAAPEQIAPERFGSTDPRTDVYQMGALFYELVTGRTPFPGGSLAAQTRAILEEPPAPPSSLVPEARPVDALILRCMEKEKSRRYQSAEEVSAALAVVMACSSITDPAGGSQEG